VNLTIRVGGTAIIMERFDPEHYLELVERWGITHTQLVPTMFSRMLKLPEQARKRHDLSSLEIAIHAAAPCPALVKEDIIKWWGPRHRGAGIYRLQHRGMAQASRHRRKSAARRSPYP
jgi:long-chain acyl-CoA synthetase